MYAYYNGHGQFDNHAINSLLRKALNPVEFMFMCYDFFPTVYQNLNPKTPFDEAKAQQLVDYCHQHDQFEILLPLLRDANPNQYLEYDPVFRNKIAPQHRQIMSQRTVRFFIAYNPKAEPDRYLASYLHLFLTKLEHEVYLIDTWPTDETGLRTIDQQIKQSGYFIALLSEQSVDSEMLRAEVGRAYDHYQEQHLPKALFVTMAYDDPLPYSIDMLIPHATVLAWNGNIDHERIGQDILTIVEKKYGQLKTNELRLISPARYERTITDEAVISEDGRLIDNPTILLPPMPEFDPRCLEELTAPGGAVTLRDDFYIERPADQQLHRELLQPYGTTTTIRAARQMGKSSLLVRGMHRARQRQARIIYLDLQSTDQTHLTDLDAFLRYLAEQMARRLRLSPELVNQRWNNRLGPKDRLTIFVEDEILRPSPAPIVLALDEVDILVRPENTFHTEFFSLLRSWHNNRAIDFEGLWDKLFIVMAISTEPYLLIQDVNQSPFNVGLKIYLKDFDPTQVYELNWRHGAPVRSHEFGEFMQLLNGHPYLTRKALYTMVTQKISWSAFYDVADHDDGPFSDHLLRHYWLLMNDNLGLATALKAIIRHNYYDDEIAILRLLKAGLIKGAGNYYSCRCDLYRRYFEDRL